MTELITPRVFVVESNDEHRRKLLDSLTAMQFRVGEFVTAESALESLTNESHGCVLANLRLEGMSGLELHERMSMLGSPLPVVLMSERVGTPIVVRAIRRGVVGFLNVPVDEDALWLELGEAMRKNTAKLDADQKKSNLRARFVDLSPGERDVLNMVCSGLTNKQIAVKLDVSVRTVESRRRRLLEKTHSESIPNLILAYGQYQWVCPDEFTERSNPKNGEPAGTHRAA